MAAASRDMPAALSTAARLVSFAVICGVLYWGRVILIPIALAALVTFMLAPVVTRLDRLRVPRVLAVLVVSFWTTLAVGGLGYFVVGELGQLVMELPAYRQNIRAKVADLKAFTRGGAIERVQTTIDDISRDVGIAASEEAPMTASAGTAEPMQVEVVPERQLLGQTEALSPALEAAATLGLTILLSIVMLIRREDLRNRLVSLAGHTSIAVTTKAFADAGRRISRYLLMQLVINGTMGLAVGIGLYFIGVPYAVLWGLAAAIFRYVPYVGPWAAALLPITVSLVTAPGWEQVALVIVLFAVLELLSNNVMEPWLYGQSVGLSSLAVIVSAIFWTWMWGPVGLVLATPLTACLVVFARRIPELAVFDRLLSERPVLEPHLWLYQRLLARDEDEAEVIVAKHLADHSLAETCDQLLIGTLLAFKRDIAAGRVTADEEEFVASALGEIVDDLPKNASEAEPAGGAEEPVLLLGFPVRDRLDEIALNVLGAVLRGRRAKLEVLSADTLIGERIAQVEQSKPAGIVVASLPPGDLTATRHACKRLRGRLPRLELVVGRLGGPKASARSAELLRAAGAKTVCASLAELESVAQEIARKHCVVAPKPADNRLVSA